MQSILIAALLTFCATLHAQVLVEITFDVNLPVSTPPADTLYVAGNFQNWEPGTTPLTRDSPTHAYGSVMVPQGSALEFKFTRGAWEKVEKAEDCSEVANRTATADTSKTIACAVANWADSCVAFYDARARKIELAETMLGVPKAFYIYTPPGYEQATGRRYPALYLFRGHETEWINKNQDASRGGRNVIDVYEDLLASGEVGPMILVFPGSSSDDNSVSGMVSNFKSPELTDAPGIGNGKFEDYLLQDVIGYVDANFRTVAHRTGRGVDGFSLGGFMSVKIGAQHPELFRTVGAFDGTHFYSRVSCSEVDIADQTFLNSMFDPVFGNPRDTAYAALNNGPSLVCNSTPAVLQTMRWFIQHGPLSSEPNDANYLRGDHLIQKLTEKGVTNELTAVLNGGHTWAMADEHMRQTFPLHWAVLGPATVYPLTIDSVTRTENGHPLIKGKGTPLAQYQVEATTMLGAQFQPLATVTADADGDLSFEDETAGNLTRRFYRFAR